MLHRVFLFGNIECLFKLSLLQWLANSCLYLTTASAEPHTCGSSCFSFLELHKEKRWKARLRLGIQRDASNRKYGTLHSRFLHPCIHITRPNITNWRKFWMWQIGTYQQVAQSHYSQMMVVTTTLWHTLIPPSACTSLCLRQTSTPARHMAAWFVRYTVWSKRFRIFF